MRACSRKNGISGIKTYCARQRTHLTLGSILVFFCLRHFSAHRSQFGCVIPDLDKNRNPFNCRLSSVKSSPKAPGAEIRVLWTERDRFTKATPFPTSGVSQHQGEMFVFHQSSGHRCKHPAVPLSRRTVNTTLQPVRGHPRTLTLSPPRFLLHQYTLMKGNQHATTAAVLHTERKKKNHDLLCCDKEEEQNKSGEFRAAARIFPLSDDGGGERDPQNNRNWTTEASYVDKKPDRDAMYCSWCDQGPSC